MKLLKRTVLVASLPPIVACLIPALALFLASMALVVVAGAIAHIVLVYCDD